MVIMAKDDFKKSLIDDLIEKYGKKSRRVIWFEELTKTEHRPKYLLKVYRTLMKERD